jgi:hypothetical protein
MVYNDSGAFSDVGRPPIARPDFMLVFAFLSFSIERATVALAEASASLSSVKKVPAVNLLNTCNMGSRI